MKRIFLSLLILASLITAPAVAQETAATGQGAAPDAAAPAAAPAPAAGGTLAPPPDNAPAPAPSAAATTTTTTTTTSSKSVSHSESARIRQQEIIRRQELLFRADESMKTARKSELAADYPDARKDYLFAAEAYSSISRATTSYATAAEGLTRVDFVLIDDAYKAGDTARQKLLVDEIVRYNPNNKEANKRLAVINKALANPNDTSLIGNPAITPGFVQHVDDVQRLFDESEQFRRTGQWDLAEARLKTILGIDPYNIAAAKRLELIVAQKNKYDDGARFEMRDERLRQVEEKWYEPINNKLANNKPGADQGPLTATTNFNIEQKLRTIYLSLEFTNATIEEATNYLSIESKRLDPDKKGVNFIIQPEASNSAKPVTLSLNNVPLGEALRYICQLANVKFKVQDYAISIVPFSSSTEDLIRRTFVVQPDFVQPPPAVGVVGSATGALSGGPISARPIPPSDGSGGLGTTDESAGDTVRQALMAKGLKFPPGASAVYTAASGELVVVDTADQMELLDELVTAGHAPTLMVRVATKFVEINQTDVNDLTFNTSLNAFAPVNGFNHTITPQFTTGLPGSLGFSPDSIDQLIVPQATVANTFSIRSAFLGADQFNMVITALSQKKSFDLLSEPTVLTKSGDQGVLEAVRVFPYPISFDPPQLVTQTTTGTVVTTNLQFTPPTAIATTPTDFKRRNVGVRLVVKPQVTADNRTIDLSLFPEVTDFEGFINYGSKIFVANPSDTVPFSLLSTNEINQPVFNTRRINTKVLIRDGSTVVLGGLIRDDVQNINDRVPLLGDLPLVGRLFQSKAVSNTKRNLIIFVTANIYRNDGELLNPPESSQAINVLTSSAGFTQGAVPTP